MLHKKKSDFVLPAPYRVVMQVTLIDGFDQGSVLTSMIPQGAHSMKGAQELIDNDLRSMAGDFFGLVGADTRIRDRTYRVFKATWEEIAIPENDTAKVIAKARKRRK